LRSHERITDALTGDKIKTPLKESSYIARYENDLDGVLTLTTRVNQINHEKKDRTQRVIPISAIFEKNFGLQSPEEAVADYFQGEVKCFLSLEKEECTE
jgi:hypothetical protein